MESQPKFPKFKPIDFVGMLSTNDGAEGNSNLSFCARSAFWHTGAEASAW